jgi:uncharacterized integral membrane protein
MGSLVVCGAPPTKGALSWVQESPSDSTRPLAQGRRLGGGAIASLSGVGLLVIFMLQNTQRVRLDFLFWTFTWPLWLLTMASALLGALVWLGLGVMRRHRRRKERRQADGTDSQPALVAEPDHHHVAGRLVQQPRGLGHAARDGPRRCGYRYDEPWDKDGSAVGRPRPTKKSAFVTPPTSPLTVLRELRRCRLAWRSPPTRSHGGSQGFKSVASAFGLLAAIAVLLSLDDFGSKRAGRLLE